MYVIKVVEYHHYGIEEASHIAKSYDDALRWINANYNAEEDEYEIDTFRDKEADATITIEYADCV